jgi:pimeloyl-ACP methyl ester carboxylesterase
MPALARLAAVAFGLFGCAAASAQGVVADLPLPGGGEERVVFVGPANPSETLVMLAGGDGIVEIDSSGYIGRLGGNFLLRTRALWLETGVAVEILGPPNGKSLLGLRHTAEYAEAIGRAVDFARGKADAPVWLVGTSNGTIAAVNGAARLAGRIAGVVLSSSVTRWSRSNETVFDSDPGAIAAPALIVANRGDRCPVSPPEDAPRIAAAMTRAAKKEVVLFDSSEIRSAPCEAMSPHGYLGIEREVVGRIVGWIRAAAPH